MIDVEVGDSAEGPWGPASAELCLRLRRECLETTRREVGRLLAKHGDRLAPGVAAQALELAMAEVARRFDESAAAALAAHALRKAGAGCTE